MSGPAVGFIITTTVPRAKLSAYFAGYFWWLGFVGIEIFGKTKSAYRLPAGNSLDRAKHQTTPKLTKMFRDGAWF